MKSIEYNAFLNCSKLVEIFNLSALELELGNKENGQIAYHAVVIHNNLSNNSILVKENDYIFTTIDNKNYLIAYIGDSTNITLPSNFKQTTYAIYQYAFYNSGIESVVIPDGVDGIGYQAFGLCSDLRYAIFENPYGWKYKYITSVYEFNSDSLKDSVLAAEMLGGGSFSLSSYDDQTWYKEP